MSYRIHGSRSEPSPFPDAGASGSALDLRPVAGLVPKTAG